MTVISHSNCPLCGSNKLQPYKKVKDYSISGESFELEKCGNCSFLFTQNAPDIETIGPYYESEDYISHSDTKKGIINRLYHIGRKYMLAQKRNAVIHKSGISKGSLLDIGCGTGYFTEEMNKHGWKVAGVEQDPKAREFAIKNFGLNVSTPDNFLQNDGGTHDVISLWHVLEHLHEMDAFIQKIHASLKDNGTLVIALPNYTSYDGNYYKANWAAFDVPRHLWHFSPVTLEKLINKHGFTLTGLKIMPLDPIYVSMLSEKYKGTFAGFVIGGIIGSMSMIKSFFNRKKSSSVIYFARKSEFL